VQLYHKTTLPAEAHARATSLGRCTSVSFIPTGHRLEASVTPAKGNGPDTPRFDLADRGNSRDWRSSAHHAAGRFRPRQAAIDANHDTVFRLAKESWRHDVRSAASLRTLAERFESERMAALVERGRIMRQRWRRRS